MIRARTFTVLTLGALLLSGCTLVPTAQAPQKIAPHLIQFGLLGPTIPGTRNGRVRFITQPIYIVDVTGDLTASSRIVPAPPVLATVLRQLINGPTLIEAGGGYTSALPKNLALLSASIKGAIGYIDLATPLTTMKPRLEELAVGQLVLTAKAAGAPRGIEVAVAGVAQRLLLPNGKRAFFVTPAEFERLVNG